MKIEGICAIITGAADGIGRAVAEELLVKGAKFVAVLDINETKGEETTKDLTEKFGKERVKFILCNVAKNDEIESAFQKAFDVHKHLDVIINNAGVTERHSDILQINLGSVITGSYLAKDYLSKGNGGKGGVLINTGSLSGLCLFKDARYTATKHGVVGFSLSLALQDSCFSKDDIRVGVICPGFVTTGITQNLPPEVVFVSMDQVVEAYVLMIEDDTKHSCCIRVTPNLGIDLHPITCPQQFAKYIGVFRS
ncbi:15-hydroxyprostaglandin dehydrogenase [NAD(+)] [Holothuria leucospilota]|uniref:15-hydroxyprostaglandin dehydrogenase [NAD(+)] n=1 Tax=Holothuria leucospilota TaxID=206669 RepID=A0A9Q1CEU5_HOLLE|nr:15-hydroxyprostaglandin dehydrogenase [NAD(+)] [Holothuria leucospilota]